MYTGDNTDDTLPPGRRSSCQGEAPAGRRLAGLAMLGGARTRRLQGGATLGRLWLTRGAHLHSRASDCAWSTHCALRLSLAALTRDRKCPKCPPLLPAASEGAFLCDK